MNSILECSKRTITKIAYRMKLACFNCGWDQARCDIHHIIPRSKGGSDFPDNLTYICPNCHRLAHSNKITVFRSIAEVIGDKWKDFYDVTPRKGRARSFTGKKHSVNALVIARNRRSELAKERAMVVIDQFRKSQIDMSVYGWKQQASKILGISPQKVTWYLKKYSPELLDGAMNRKKMT